MWLVQQIRSVDYDPRKDPPVVGLATAAMDLKWCYKIHQDTSRYIKIHQDARNRTGNEETSRKMGLQGLGFHT